MPTIHQRVTVQAGGRVEFDCPELQAGEIVEVTVLRKPAAPRRSIVEIINDGPGQRLFKTAKEVDDYLAEERASWER